MSEDKEICIREDVFRYETDSVTILFDGKEEKPLNINIKETANLDNISKDISRILKEILEIRKGNE